MKCPAMFLILFLLCSNAFAQKELAVKSGSKGLYLEHKVAAKENFFSIGRLYNTHPRSVAAYNSLQLDKGLSLGQVIRIPLNDTNFDQRSGKGVPVFYIPASGESVNSISTKHKKLPVDLIMLWNDLPGENVDAGIPVVVGFLNSKDFKSQVVDYSKRKKTPLKDKETVKSEIKEPQTEKVAIKKEETKKPEVIPVRNDASTANGFFRSDFEKQVRRYPLSKEQMVTSGIFKTTSGWQDAKYYLLIDKVEPGTIVKVTNPINNKAIYAKVLYGMEGIRQNDGLDIRISNAAASSLGITDTEKFVVKVNY